MQRAMTVAVMCVTLVSLGPTPGAAQQRQAEAVVSGPEPREAELFEPWNGGRYRLTPGDVVVVAFPYVSEFDQELIVQPDGYVTLRAVGELRVQGRTLPELRQMLYDAYEPILKEPVVTLTLKEFEQPYFVATGEVKQPGKFELRGATTVIQGLAMAGGLTGGAKHSQVILFRRFSDALLEVKEVNVKEMLARRDASEDPLLRPGDTLFVPRSALSRVVPFIPRPGIGVYVNPFQ